MAEMYKVGQLVCSTWKLPQWEAYELGIILEVWEDSDYPYKVEFFQDPQDVDWYTHEGIKDMVADLNKLYTAESS